jgi:hypothetical protein
MIIPMESLILLLLSLLSLLNLLRPHHPRHHNILIVLLAPAPSTAFLLQGPDVHERFATGLEVREDGLDGFCAAFCGGEVVDDCY